LEARSGPYLALAALAALAAIAAIAAGEGAGHAAVANRDAAVPGMKAQFTLTTSSGEPVSERSYRGKWLLVYFGFTICPDACPTALLSIGRTLDALGPLARDIQPLFITIDPERDTRTVMAAYLTSFDPRIVGLVGSPQQIAAAARHYRVYDSTRDLGEGAYAIDHSSFIYVVSPHGQVAKIMTGDLSSHSMTDQLRRLIR
jgi:protein SCO1